MSNANQSPGSSERELTLTRIFDAPPEMVYRAWTEPELMKQWFTPSPWSTSHVETDVRPGGSTLIVMRSPEGQDHPNYGVYLEVEKNRRLVYTDAYTRTWEPSEQAFMTVILTFEDLGGKTRYTARVLHWTVAERRRHEQMGFHEGWGKAADQLADLLKRMQA